ncbi:MAG: TetR family transcriptional regulator [Bryobacteraceae bacterium]|nr:TetR family transcriptional regulator [Bryobacteraceae bacterium]
MSLLEAAARVFGEVGYAKATTNAIAQEAGVSPGTFYQFFPNKQSIVEALADRYVRELDLIHANLGDVLVLSSLPIEDLVDGLVDPFITFHTQHPAFEAMFVEAGLAPESVNRKQVLEDSLTTRLTRVFRNRKPDLRPRDALWTARVCSSIFKGMMPLISAHGGQQRTRLIRELKSVLTRYILPITG